ncbi:MAG: hypothetical protein ACI865_002286 [Flavobacteriaceae bacterium]|jgi:hypothetical protein
MKIISLLSLLFLTTAAISQTWSDDVAEIVYEKCTKCHHNGGVGPFPLMTYAEASPMAVAMASSIISDEMPPWPPNKDYQEYVHDRSLTPAEKITLLDWLAAGVPEGIPANTPPPPVYTAGSLLGNGDLELQIPVYMSKATTSDDYVCFAIPSGLPTDRTIRAIEIIPGNTQTVHHALIYIDPNSGNVTDTVGGDCAGPNSPTSELVMGYTPGSTPMVLPSVSPLKMGMAFPANGQVVFAMHYPEGSYGTYDSTKVIFHFYPVGETGIRPVATARLLEDWSFSLPPNQLTNVSDVYPNSGGLLTDFSLISVFPHMHLIGKSMEVYGILPSLDTLKLIDIPDWDFEWQDFYFYKNLQKAEVGTVLHADAVFDNTASNPNNPNSPPITVGAGLNTSDEMMLAFMHYMAYLPGDENYDMDSLLNLSTVSIIEASQSDELFTAYPNPFTNGVSIYSPKLTSGDVLSIFVYNIHGKRIARLMDNNVITSSELLLEWDGNNEDGSPVSGGMYYISINRNGQLSNHRVVKQ